MVIKKTIRFCWRMGSFLTRGMRRALILPFQRLLLASCGKGVRIERNCRISYRNLSVGQNSSIGEGSLILSENAKIFIGKDCMLAPQVRLISGDHRIDIQGRPMRTVTPAEKLAQNDQDIVIGDDVWIGTGAILLKGVHVGTGSVIGAGSVVTHDIPPYSIYTGCPTCKLRPRFQNKAD